MHVVFRLQPNGMELGVIKLVNGLSPALITSSICSTRPADPVKRLLQPHVTLFELDRREGNDIGLVWRLYRLFRRERPEIVHTHAWGTLCEGLLAARLARVPVVIHGEHGTLQTRSHQVRMQRWAWRRVSRLLSVSSRLAERMVREVGVSPDRVTVISNGVDLSRFSAASSRDSRRAIGLPERGLVIGTVGRLVEVKNQAALLEAVATLVGEGVPCTLVIAGEGPLRPLLEERIRSLGLSDAVRLLGHRSDIHHVFGALDLFVLPSRSEGMSNTILEAMASSLPVVATNVGGADEMVAHGETGLLVPAGDALALSGALRTLALDAAKRESMGRSGRLRMERQFSLETMIRKYEQLYLAAAADGGTP
jgi:sugar transferase (PEP-CTERM/EpsH1 system associated)